MEKRTLNAASLAVVAGWAINEHELELANVGDAGKPAQANVLVLVLHPCVRSIELGDCELIMNEHAPAGYKEASEPSTSDIRSLHEPSFLGFGT